MAYPERAVTQEHNITLTGRKTLKISGVSHVERFDDEEVTVSTCMGLMIIQGQDMHMEKLSLENGEMIITGSIDGISYENTAGAEKGLLKRLFK